MRKTLHAVVLAVALVALWAPTAGADNTTARALLDRLAVAAENPAGYNRDLYFGGWIDADRDCQDTRAEVLIAESWTPVTFTTASKGCTVATGAWYSWYDSAGWTTASSVQIDHLVPLKEAWDSGAQAWTQDRRRLFANDLDYGPSLVAITSRVNQSKSDRDPAEWLPPYQPARCDYAINWVQVKARWGLTVDPTERTTLAGILTGACGAKVVAAPPVVK